MAARSVPVITVAIVSSSLGVIALIGVSLVAVAGSSLRPVCPGTGVPAPFGPMILNARFLQESLKERASHGIATVSLGGPSDVGYIRAAPSRTASRMRL